MFKERALEAIVEGLHVFPLNGKLPFRGSKGSKDGTLDLEITKNDIRKLSKELIKPTNDTWRAFLQVRTEVFYNFIINTPSMLKKNMQELATKNYLMC